jgi:hypothetical protein
LREGHKLGSGLEIKGGNADPHRHEQERGPDDVAQRESNGSGR